MELHERLSTGGNNPPVFSNGRDPFAEVRTESICCS